jgi:transcription termination factor NusB
VVEMEIIDQIAELERKLSAHEKRLSILEGLFKTETEHVKKKLSIKEFILTKNVKDDQQNTLAIGYFLEKYENYISFNIRDLEQGFRDAKMKPPQNINDKVNKNIIKGYMMENREKKDNKKAWVITNTGEIFVEAGFKEG